MISKSVALKAQFYDVDSMNVVWHGNYVKYFETARCALLEEIATATRRWGRAATPIRS